MNEIIKKYCRDLEHDFRESEEKYSDFEDGNTTYYIVIFCKKCGIIIKEVVSKHISSW